MKFDGAYFWWKIKCCASLRYLFKESTLSRESEESKDQHTAGFKPTIPENLDFQKKFIRPKKILKWFIGAFAIFVNLWIANLKLNGLFRHLTCIRSFREFHLPDLSLKKF